MRRRLRAVMAAMGCGAMILGGLIVGAAPANAAAFEDLFTISTTGLNFGDDIPFGSPNVEMTYTITALEDATLITGGWYTPGPDQWLGEVASGACAGMNVFNSTRFMAAGSVCTMTVTFNPNISLAPVNSVQGGRGWSARGQDGTTTEAQDIPYTALVWSLERSPIDLSFVAAPGVESAPQTVTVTNRAVVPLGPIAINGLISPPFSIDAGACAAGLAVGASCDLTFTYQGGAIGDQAASQLTFVYSATGPNGPKTSNSLSTMVRLNGYTWQTPPTADIAITKSLISDVPLTVGAEIEWQIQVANNGPDASPGAVAYDFPDDGLSFVRSDAPGCGPLTEQPGGQTDVSVTEGFWSCDLGPLAAGESITFSVFTRILDDVPPGSVLVNSAYAYGQTSDPDYSNNGVNAESGPTEPLASLRLDKTALTPAADVGSDLEWEITAANDGPNDALNAVVVDTLPAGLVLASTPDECTVSGQTLTCQIGTLTPGQTAAIHAVTTVESADLAGQTVTNTATVSTSSVERSTENDTAEATALVNDAVVPPTPTPTTPSSGSGALAESGPALSIVGLVTAAVALLLTGAAASTWGSSRRRKV